MGKENGQLNAAKRAYGNARAVGNRQEEARWANVVGDILKNRGEYVEALRWLRIDYEVSIKYLPEKDLLPTCQSLGEVYLRLRHFKDALLYQKKHLELAKDANDLIEQQRATTQLGRTYHEMLSKSEDDNYSVRNAKKYFKLAMRLAQTLKENPPTQNSSFLKEYIDAHNNIGMLQMDLDNLEEAQKILIKGLEICDEEEVSEDDDCRSRLHHNLGSVYTELRMWDEAREHIEKDIVICKRIAHCEGEAKGYINLGELHYRVQKYEDAIRCYQKALDLAKSMEDEDALAEQINQNIETVKQATKVMQELKKEEQNFKKLSRNMVTAKGTSHEWRCLMQQYASLDCLIEKSSTISAWLKHYEFAKQKKRIASELCDKGKLGDSFMGLGESYQKLRNFKKAIKWFKKSWETYKSIGNLEGQASSKISIGNVMDSDGDWTGALNAFEEGYKIAVEAKLPSVQLSALENMHYSHMMRFDDTEEARRLQLKIDNLKQQKSGELEKQNLEMDCCSETDTEGDGPLSDGISHSSHSTAISKTFFMRSKNLSDVEMLDDMPLISLLWSNKHSPSTKNPHAGGCNSANELIGASPDCLPKTNSNQQTVVGRKRVRVVFSDDEDEMHDKDKISQRSQKWPVEDVATSDELRRKSNSASAKCRIQQDPSAIASQCGTSSCSPITIEESSCSYKSLHPKVVIPNGNFFKSSSIDEVAFAPDFAASGSKCDLDVSEKLVCKHDAVNLKLHGLDSDTVQYVTFKIDELINMERGSCIGVDRWHIESMKAKLSCLYYLQLPIEKRSKGLLPIIHQIKCAGTVLESSICLENLKDDLGNIEIEVSIAGWVQKRLMKLYIDSCNELSEVPNMKLLERLYISEVEEEIRASECELQDVSVIPLLNALLTHKTAAMLDLSHNLLGNGTMEKLQQIFSSGQKYGALTLDLHCNRFGSTALFQICECPVLFTRLEVLNISGNRLTDACGSYLSTILENCKALYSLNIERCSITSRTIQKVADALKAGSVLAQLCIGYNHPVSGNAISNLLAKLSALESFADLNLNGLKFNKPVIDSLCQFSKTACLSRLMLGSTGIGTDAALQLTEALCSASQDSVKLDLSFCGLTSSYVHKLNTGIALSSGIVVLNLGGNPILEEGTDAIVSLLSNPQSCLTVLVLDKCELGLDGVLQLIWALAENKCLEELHLADNVNSKKKYAFENDQTVKESSDILLQNCSTPEPSVETCPPEEPHTDQQVLCVVNTGCNQLEVADSEDSLNRENATRSEVDGSCISSSKKNSLECEFILDLSRAIGSAKHLQFLDLSNNGFTEPVAEALYNAWSSRLGAGLAWRHIKDQIVHLSVETSRCCRVRSCCRKD